MAADKPKFVFNPFTGNLDSTQDVSLLVEGPTSATDNAIVVYDSTTGKLIKNSSAVVQTDGRVTAGADGSSSLDLITKQQLDAAIQGVDVKDGARVASTVNLTLSAPQTVDTVSVIAGDRVLVKNQSTASENGVYVVAAGSWARATDSNTAAELNSALVTVAEGSQANTGWYQSAEIVTLGTDPVTFTQFFGAGTYTADGNGIEISGSTFSLELNGTTLSKDASGLKVAALGITNSEVATSAAISLSKLAALTANKATATDSSGIIVTSATTDTELGYVSGVTSAIQTQLNGKEGTITTLPISKGGTNSGTALNNNRIIISNSGAIVENTAITASRALASDTNGIPVAATTTTTELNYVSGVTSAIQTQLNGKQASGSYALDTLANLSTTAINANLIFDKTNAILQTKNNSAATSATITVTSGTGTGFGTGDLNLNTGTSDTTSSGSVNMLTGTSTAGGTGGMFFATGGKSGTQTGGTGAVTINSGDYSSSSNSATGAITLRSGDKSGTGTAGTGDVTIRTGSASTANGVTGIMTIQSGDQTGTGTAVSGTVVIKSGDTSGGNKLSGTVTVKTGNSAGGSSAATTVSTGTCATGFNSGALNLTSGAGSNASGLLNIKSGDVGGSSAAATTGVVTLKSGDNSNSSTGASGAVNINSGDKTTGTAASGAITVQTGTSTATSGVVSLVTGTGTATGAANITTGNASAGNSGSVVLTTGTATGTRGSVSVNALNLNMNSTKIINVTDPTSAQDAATKAYADTKAPIADPTFTGTATSPLVKYTPQSADPGSPTEGLTQYADGTVRTEGMWVYKNGAWEPVGANAGFIATDWTSFAATYVGLGTITNEVSKWRRVGSNMEIWSSITTGTTTAVSMTLTIPTSLSIDTTLLSASTRNIIGDATRISGTSAVSGSTLGLAAFYDGSDATKLFFAKASATDTSIAKGTGSGLLNSGETFILRASIPIATWAANTVAAVQSINARAHNSATSISGTLATIVWTTEDYDTNNALASGVFTVPSTGKYQVNASLAVSGTFVLNNTSIMQLQVNGTAKADVTHYIPAAITNESITLSDTIQVTAGDTVRIQYSTQGTGPAIVNSDTKNYFSISKIGN